MTSRCWRAPVCSLSREATRQSQELLRQPHGAFRPLEPDFAWQVLMHECCSGADQAGVGVSQEQELQGRPVRPVQGLLRSRRRQGGPCYTSVSILLCYLAPAGCDTNMLPHLHDALTPWHAQHRRCTSRSRCLQATRLRLFILLNNLDVLPLTEPRPDCVASEQLHLVRRGRSRS